MGGGCSGLFPGTPGADYQQISLLDEPIRVHHRGPTYIPSGGNEGGAGGNVGPTFTAKALIRIGAEEVLRQCMRYRLGVITEARLVA